MLDIVRDKLKSDLTWQEKVQIVLDYHQFCLDANPRHTLAITATSLAVSEATISFDLRLARYLRKNPDKLNQFPSKTKAINALFSKINYPAIAIRTPTAVIRGKLIRTLFIEEQEHGLIKLDKPLFNNISFDYIVYPASKYQVRYDNG